MSRWTRRGGSAAVLWLATALLGCGGGGGGGDGAGGGGWRTIRIDEFTPPAAASVAAPRSRVVVAEIATLVSPGLAFRSDGTPLVAYFAPLVWDPMNTSGELRIATVRGETADVATLVPQGTQHWSGLGIDAGDRLGFLEHVNPGPALDWGWFTGDGGGATLASTFTEADGFVKDWGRPVLAPGGGLVAPVVSHPPAGNTRLSLWSPNGAAWDLSDVVVEETDATSWRIDWGNGCVPDAIYDLAGNPVVAYERNRVVLTNPGIETLDRTFVVARKANGAWSSEDVLALPYVVVDQNGGIDRGPFLAADGTGALHLVVYVNGQLWYAVKPAGGAWTHEQIPVDAVQDTNGVGFVLDHGVPTVLFYSQTQGAALAMRKDGGWTTESIDPDGDVVNGALGIDPSGNLWAVYDTHSGNSWFLNLSTRRVQNPRPREPYFTVDGKQQFIASRNITGRTKQEIFALLDKARDEGTRLVRFHVTHGGFGLGITSGGGVDAAWSASWEDVFAHAEADGLQVLPVLGVWADWNDGSKGEAWHAWNANPLNQANGGPAASPTELYLPGTPGQQAWLGWMEQVVGRWSGHPNIAAWEVFSELDLVTHTGDETLFRRSAVSFFEAAAARIREDDPGHRPVTASAASWIWPELYRTPGMELVQLHLYGPEQVLDASLISAVRSLRELGKPVLLGESGLDWHSPGGSTETTAPQGPTGTRHAVWAALVAGAMNGRALWWEDGYAILENGDAAVPFVTGYPAVEATALEVLAGRSLASFAPVDTEVVGVGGAIGDGGTVVGWMRAAGCQPPGWSCSATVGGTSIRVGAPAGALQWQATFYDPATGAVLGDPVTLTRATPSDALSVPLPAFTDDVAFVLGAQLPAAVRRRFR